jgi:hypothetical protein
MYSSNHRRLRFKVNDFAQVGISSGRVLRSQPNLHWQPSTSERGYVLLCDSEYNDPFLRLLSAPREEGVVSPVNGCGLSSSLF